MAVPWSVWGIKTIWKVFDSTSASSCFILDPLGRFQANIVGFVGSPNKCGRRQKRPLSPWEPENADLCCPGCGNLRRRPPAPDPAQCDLEKYREESSARISVAAQPPIEAEGTIPWAHFSDHPTGCSAKVVAFLQEGREFIQTKTCQLECKIMQNLKWCWRSNAPQHATAQPTDGARRDKGRIEKPRPSPQQLTLQLQFNHPLDENKQTKVQVLETSKLFRFTDLSIHVCLAHHHHHVCLRPRWPLEVFCSGLASACRSKPWSLKER